jgi:adenosylmethionine-8-amino-7-oxononanoate aminotransferase
MTRNADLAARDKRVVWHPFTQMQDWREDAPLVIERAEGNHLIDADGRRYLDGVSSLWVTVHGHRHPRINDAIRAQLDRVAHSTLLGLASVPAIELAERLLAIAPPGLGKVFYSDSGSTAVEVALKIAFQYWSHCGRPKKRRFIALREAYHGDTIGAVSVGGIDLFHQIFHPLLFDALRAPTPYWYRCTEAPAPEACRDLCLDALAQLLAAHAGETAALILEPLVQGAAGMITHPPGYLREVARLCRQHEVLLICDEVATGFGRTATMFACEQEGVSPDLLCLAKGITGGYLPLAATLATDAIHDAFLGPLSSRRTFFHGHTYTGNPLACAAALASLQVFEEERVLAALPGKVRRLDALLTERVAPLHHVGQIRQRGLMVGIELVRDRATKAEYAFTEAIGARACRAARARGVLLRPLGSVVVLMPPLSTTDDEMVQLVDAAAHGIAAATEETR